MDAGLLIVADRRKEKSWRVVNDAKGKIKPGGYLVGIATILVVTRSLATLRIVRLIVCGFPRAAFQYSPPGIDNDML